MQKSSPEGACRQAIIGKSCDGVFRLQHLFCRAHWAVRTCQTFGIDLLTRFCGMSEEAAYDAVAAQAAASAIAAKFAQQHAAGEGDVPADDLASGKRKYEEGASADPLGDEHVRKRSNFSGPEGAYNGVSAGHVCRPCSEPLFSDELERGCIRHQVA